MELSSVAVSCQCLVKKDSFHLILEEFKKKFVNCDSKFKNLYEFQIIEPPVSFILFCPGRFTSDMKFSTTSKKLAYDVIKLICNTAGGNFEVISTRFVSYYTGKMGAGPVVTSENTKVCLKLLGDIIPVARQPVPFVGTPPNFEFRLDTTKIIHWTPQRNKFFGKEFGEVLKSILLVTGGFRDLAFIPSDILLFVLFPILAFEHQKKFLEEEKEEEEKLKREGMPKWVRKREQICFHRIGRVTGTGINPVVLNAAFYCGLESLSKK